jgi:ATP/maltotriose-dependent transcriptional regulator MalT/DNA-binding SARP family transcriptional activator
VNSIVRRFPQLADSALANPESLFLNRISIEQMVTILVNELYEKINEHFIVVVDDYHFVDGHPEIDEFISQFVQLSGDHCHLALLSRTLLSLSDLPLMIARSYVGGLSFEELRFQKGEVNELLLCNYGVSLSDAELEDLSQSTEGWITGLLLSSFRNNGEISNWARLARVSGIDLYSYLAQQVLDRQPAAIRQFLLKTSLFEEFNAPLCELILGAPPTGETWQSLVDSVFRNNLFVLNVGEGGLWLRYHHLFQEFLRQNLHRELPDEALRIQHRLANYYAQQNDWEKAYTLYRNLGDTMAIADLIKTAGTPLIKTGRYQIVAKWLEELPNQVLYGDPLLISLKGAVTVDLGNIEEGLHYLNQAAEALQSANQPLALAHTLIRRGITQYQIGNYKLAMADAEHTLELIADQAAAQEEHSPEAADTILAEALRIQGLCHYIMGDFGGAIAHLEKARQHHCRLKNRHNDTRITLEIATAHVGTGHYEQAMRFFEQVLENWRSLHNIIGQTNALNNLGVLYHLKGDYLTALSRLIEALNLCKRTGFARLESYTLASIGDLFADIGVANIAIEFYERAYPIAKAVNERFLLLHLNLALLLLALPQHRQQDAKIFLDAARRLVADSTSPFEQGLFSMVVGQYHLMGGRQDEAIVPLEEAVANLSQTDQRVETARAHLLLAAARHDIGDKRGAIDLVTQGIKIANELEDWHPLVVAGHPISTFLETVKVEDDYKTGLESLCQRMKAFHRSTPELRRRLRQQITPLLTATTAQRPQLQIRSLGRGEVILNGKVVDTSDWQTQAARDLFFCFVAHEEGLTKEEIGEIFWPESTPGQLKTRFKNAIYRLRNALHQEVIIFENDLYYFNRNVDYEYDVEIFEDAITSARMAPSPQEARRILQNITKLYQGPYLPDLDPAWAQLERERLRRLYIEAMLTLIEMDLAENDTTAALARCQSLLTDDPCLESAHRQAMCAHALRGNRADVARQYEQCCNALIDEFGIPPSQETVNLYDQLMA